ncbi:MAG TPA: ATP-binding protein [Candidatus Paceibacterota bacterium]|nr:ATP-binding protein [Verrucomicrobiota bacterium]HRY50529.1 ATP-binding protein [Candidatus Paceibacterota bacterium]HRZ99971.1 ATP-binding protein [Candidatus Paceibacterota bacterium]
MSIATSNRLKLCFKNQLPELIQAMQQVEEHLSTLEVSPQAVYSTNLAIEEMATNIIKYGFDDRNEHLIEIQVGIQSDEIVITLIDDGHEFNPLNAPVPDVTQGITERIPGGLGIHLIRTMSRQMRYERLNGRNILNVHIDRFAQPHPGV